MKFLLFLILTHAANSNAGQISFATHDNLRTSQHVEFVSIRAGVFEAVTTLGSSVQIMTHSIRQLGIDPVNLAVQLKEKDIEIICVAGKKVDIFEKSMIVNSKQTLACDKLKEIIIK